MRRFLLGGCQTSKVSSSLGEQVGQYTDQERFKNLIINDCQDFSSSPTKLRNFLLKKVDWEKYPRSDFFLWRASFPRSDFLSAMLAYNCNWNVLWRWRRHCCAPLYNYCCTNYAWVVCVLLLIALKMTNSPDCLTWLSPAGAACQSWF